MTTKSRKTPRRASSRSRKPAAKKKQTPRRAPAWKWSALVRGLSPAARRYARQVETGEVQDQATAYAVDVIAGRKVAGPFVRLACARHLRDLGRKALRWELEEAERAIAYFGVVLKLNGEGFEGKPFKLSPHQAFRIGSLYGWQNPDGSRRFRYFYVEEGKGNGKSPELAGLGVKGLTGDGVPRAEVYFAAPKKEQAMIPFRDAVAMVDLSPVLRSRVKKSGQNPTWNLAYPSNGSFARPVSNDERQSGPRPYMALLEELHEHRDSTIVDLLMAGAKGRKNFVCGAITNSGIFGEESLCWNWRQKSIDVLNASSTTDAGFDDSWFAYVAALDEGDDPFADETCWVKANPNLGVSIQPEYLRERVRTAQTMPSQEGIVRRLNFCQWIEAVSAWIPVERWDECGAPVDPSRLRGRPCFPALDLSSTRDFTALVLVFPPAGETDPYQLLPFIFVPEETLRQRTGRDRNVPYEQWARAGFLHVTPGDAVDQNFIKQKFLEQAELYRFVECPFDRWQASKLVTELQDEGFSMVAMGQGYESLSMPTKLFEELVLKRRIAHGAHPVLRWMLSNVRIRPGPAEAVKPDKAKSRDRIDGIVASIMGLARASVVPTDDGSVYEKRGILVA